MLPAELNAILEQACNVKNSKGELPSEKMQIALVQSLIAAKGAKDAAEAAAKLLGDKITKGLVHVAEALDRIARTQE